MIDASADPDIPTDEAIAASLAKNVPRLLARLREDTPTHVCSGSRFCFHTLLLSLLAGTCTEEQRQMAALALNSFIQARRVSHAIMGATAEVVEQVNTEAEVEVERAGGGKGKVGHA